MNSFTGAALLILAVNASASMLPYSAGAPDSADGSLGLMKDHAPAAPPLIFIADINFTGSPTGATAFIGLFAPNSGAVSVQLASQGADDVSQAGLNEIAEPASLGLVGVALLGIGLFRRSRTM